MIEHTAKPGWWQAAATTFRFLITNKLQLAKRVV